MKKKILAALIIAAALVSVFSFAACEKKDEVRVASISCSPDKAKDDYKVGGTFDTASIIVKALLTDGTEVTFTNTKALVFDKSELNLTAAGAFTQVGTFKLHVGYLRFKAECDIVVAAAD
jgi:hypothetical protein